MEEAIAHPICKNSADYNRSDKDDDQPRVRIAEESDRSESGDSAHDYSEKSTAAEESCRCSRALCVFGFASKHRGANTGQPLL